MNANPEMLKLAAKAVGLNVKAEGVDPDDRFTHLVVGAKNTRERVTWNPLTDDGDAMRLGVKLQFSIEAGRPFGRVIDTHGKVYRVLLSEVDDPFAAVRLAIVRAAAEIGKAMP